MRKTILTTIVTIMTIAFLSLAPLSQKILISVLASNAKPFPAQGMASVSINDASNEGNSGVGTILNEDDPTAPQLTALLISDTSLIEGDIGSTGANPSANFTVRLSAATSFEVRVNYATEDGTATVADHDYVSQSDTVVFPPNDTTPKTISIQVVSDSRVEGHETFSVRLTSPTGAAISDGEGVCSIFNDDGGSPLPRLSINDVSLFESDFGTVDATFLVSLSFASSSTVTVNYATSDGSATVGTNDYQAKSDTVTFPPGDASSKTISIRVVGDIRREPDEIFFVNLSNPQSAIIERAQGVCTIQNDDLRCAYEFSTGRGQLTGQIISSTGGSNSIIITTGADCVWTAFVANGGSWVRLLSPSDGLGSSTLIYSVEPNADPDTRTTRIVLGPVGLEYTVIQEGLRCTAATYRFTPENTLLDNDGHHGQFDVMALDGCRWIPSTDDSWIDVMPSQPLIRMGPGTVTFDVKPNPALWRSGAITVAGKPFNVHQISPECVTEFLCPYFSSSCTTGGASTLALSRTFRDGVLARTSRGERYTRLYYTFSSEAIQILMLNPMLILRSRDMMERYMPVVGSMVKGEQVSLTEGDIDEIDGFLRSFAEKGGAELKETIMSLCKDLRDPQVHGDFNITVTKGPKRELTGQIGSSGISRPGLMIAPLGLILLCFYRQSRIRRKQLKTAFKRFVCAVLLFSMAGGPGSALAGRGGVGQIQTTRLPASPAKAEEIKAARANKSSARLPLSFETNQGQFDSQVRFISRANGYNLYLTGTEAVMAFGRYQGSTAATPGPQPSSTLITPALSPRPSMHATQLRMKLIEANPDPRTRGLDEIPGRANYFIGDAARWRENIPSYARVEYENVYKGIDLVYYGSHRELEYDFKVAPGADPAAIGFGIEGADDIEIDSQGALVMRVAGGEVRQRKPLAYQEINGSRRVIPARYVFRSKTSIRNPQSAIRNRTVGFEIGAYDKSRPLIIDPVLTYSTYFGGNGNEEGSGIAVDPAGNVYVTGFTDSINFPLANPSQSIPGGGQQEAFVVKLDPSGTRLLYSTYIGGNGQDNGTSIAVDSAGNAYITGFTDSINFPVRNALQATKKGSFNAFVVKLDATGSVLNSTLFGGSFSDYGSSIAVDSSGNVYVAGLATSPDIPMSNALQSTNGGLVDIYMAKIDSSGTRLVYSTYLGGSGIDGASSITVDSAGNLFLAGMTSSLDFHTMNPLQARHGGGIFDAFVAKLNPSGTQILYSTYLGGSGEDRALRIAVDTAGSAYITGDTDSVDFPVRNAFQPARGGSSDAFVAKLNPQGSALAYSTYLGGSGIDGATAIAVDAGGSSHVTGFTNSNNFPTSAALQQVFGGGSFDAFLTKLSPAGSTLDYSTYLGGDGVDSGFGVAMESGGRAHVMGVTGSTNFPTSNALQQTFGGGTADLFIMSIQQGPAIVNANITGKKLLVSGSGFDMGARILLNGQQQKTFNDEQSPSTTLIGKKAGKMIGRGQTVTIQVRNADGTLSNEFSFTRPAN